MQNLDNVLKARPSIPQYPRISTALGQAVTSVVQGRRHRRRRWTTPQSRRTRSWRSRLTGSDGARRRDGAAGSHSDHVAGWAFAFPPWP